jgi:hypothetical protein
MTAFDRDNLQLIFSALVDWWMRKHALGPTVAKVAKGLVRAAGESLQQWYMYSSKV